MINLVDFQSEYNALQDQINASIEEVLTSGQFIGGAIITDFERNFAQFMQCKHVIACGNGTDALQIALMALGIKEGDEVIVPAFTFVAPAEAVKLLGAEPVVVDVDPIDYTIDIEKIREALTEKTKAIIPVHLFGQAANMDEIRQIAEEHNIFIIEDNAQATGTYFKDRLTGTIGHIGCTSFFPTKNLGCYGDGGALMTNYDALAQKARMLASHGQKGEKFYHPIVGINSRLDALQAAILNTKLPLLPQYIAQRKAIAQRYIEQLSALSDIQLPLARAGRDHTYHQFVIWIKNGRRDALKNYLKEEHIGTGVYYPYAVNELPPYKSKYDCSIAEQLAGNTLALPIHPYLSENNQSLIIQKIKDFFNG